MLCICVLNTSALNTFSIHEKEKAFGANILIYQHMLGAYSSLDVCALCNYLALQKKGSMKCTDVQVVFRFLFNRNTPTHLHLQAGLCTLVCNEGI